MCEEGEEAQCGESYNTSQSMASGPQRTFTVVKGSGLHLTERRTIDREVVRELCTQPSKAFLVHSESEPDGLPSLSDPQASPPPIPVQLKTAQRIYEGMSNFRGEQVCVHGFTLVVALYGSASAHRSTTPDLVGA